MDQSKIVTTSQILAIADEYKLPHSTFRSLLAVESSGHGFSSITDRLIIRFEPAWFKKEFAAWVKDNLETTWENTGSNNQTDEWTAFDAAFAENADAAMKATSIGMAQIMGFHYDLLGFANVGAMWDHAKISEANQVEQLAIYISKNHELLAAIRNRDFPLIATLYNGAAYKELAAKNNTVPYDEQLGKWDLYFTQHP